MATDYFFGITLSSTNKEFKWEPDELNEENGGNVTFTPKGEHCLLLRQAVLTGGVDGEKNIVEVETAGFKSQVKIPIVSLVGGKSTHIALDITLPDPPVTIRLLEGSGPIHIAGIHSIQTDQFSDNDDDEEDGDESYLDEMNEEDEDEEIEAEDSKLKKEKENKGKKRTNSNSGPVPSKKKKNSKEAA